MTDTFNPVDIQPLTPGVADTSVEPTEPVIEIQEAIPAPRPVIVAEAPLTYDQPSELHEPVLDEQPSEPVEPVTEPVSETIVGDLPPESVDPILDLNA